MNQTPARAACSLLRTARAARLHNYRCVRRGLDALDDEHVEVLARRPLDEADHPPVRLTLAADNRAVLSFVVVEFERAERGAAAGNERERPHGAEYRARAVLRLLEPPSAFPPLHPDRAGWRFEPEARPTRSTADGAPSPL